MSKQEPYWESIVCKCGHLLSNHYRKNYMIDQNGHFGNVDRFGCDDCDNAKHSACSRFESVKVTAPYAEFEQGLLVWSQYYNRSVPLLDQIEREEIKDKMQNYEWVHKNRDRWIKILKDAGFNFMRSNKQRRKNNDCKLGFNI